MIEVSPFFSEVLEDLRRRAPRVVGYESRKVLSVLVRDDPDGWSCIVA